GQVLVRNLLCLLHEPVQQDHSPLRDAKDHAGNAVAMKRAADLQEALPQRPAHWHPDGPSVLNGGDVLADLAAILGRQASKPIADRLGTRRRPIERRSDLLQTLPTNLRYQKWYSPIRFRCRWSSTSLSRQEACLPPYGACTLGHLNLAAFARDGQLDWDALAGTTHDAVTFLDNVVEANPYTLPAIRQQALNERRIVKRSAARVGSSRIRKI